LSESDSETHRHAGTRETAGSGLVWKVDRWGAEIPHPSSKPATLVRVTLLREQVGSAFTAETSDEFIRESIKKFP
jgi:hypothetical protein